MKIPALASAVVRFPARELAAVSQPPGIVPWGDHPYTDLVGQSLIVPCQQGNYWSNCTGTSNYRCCQPGYKCDPTTATGCIKI
jgi:hypothetical protein